jgi:hypothetical protein
MPEAASVIEEVVTLSDRLALYREEVEKVVSLGVENPQFEFKRSVSLKKGDSLADRLDFVKLIHGMANAFPPQERFIVIGADQEAKEFKAVTNSDEFDPAKVQQILAKYLDPVPAVEVFRLTAHNQAPYVLVVLSPEQSRPIMACTEGRSSAKVHFEFGDVWMKQGTALVRARKADIDRMYEKRIDDEAENRARRRFQHYQEEFGAGHLPQAATRTPDRSLLVGSKEKLRLFAEEVIADGSLVRLKMLIEMAREKLVDSWDSIAFRGTDYSNDWNKWIADVRAVYKDQFTPALDSIVLLALEVIKFEGPEAWMPPILELLVESFELARTFQRLKDAERLDPENSILFGQPAYDVYVGIRTVASYAMLRRRFPYLGPILQRFVRYFTYDDRAEIYTPIVFWPFSGIDGFPDMRQGRNQALWNARIQSSWGDYFRSKERFLGCAYELEFALEFNSFIFETLQDPAVKQLVNSMPEKHFRYLPDFWNSSLGSVVHIANELLHHLMNNPHLSSDLAVDPRAFEAVFKGKDANGRRLLLGQFLGHLRSWQTQVSIQERGMPIFFMWPNGLDQVEKDATNASRAKRSS